MIPYFIVEKAFSFLDFQSQLTLRLVCRDFLCAAMPLLLRFHKSKDFNKLEYRKFLERHGRFVKLLWTSPPNSHHFRKMSISLSESFPFLRHLAMDGVKFHSKARQSRFVMECLDMRHLKFISFHNNYGYIEESEKEKIQRMEALVLKTASSIDKRVNFQLVFLPHFHNTAEPDSFVRKLVCRKQDAPTAVSFFDFLAERFLIFPKTPRLLQNLGPFERSGLLFKDSVNCFHMKSEPHFNQLANVPNLAEHCLIFRNEDDQDCARYLEAYQKIPSLELVLGFHGGYAYLRKNNFQASKLSLEVFPDDLPVFFNWTVESFPNLQHLYLANVIPRRFKFLVKNCFPKLVHFYTNLKQPDFFWTQLLDASPELLYIHSDWLLANVFRFESLKPTLQIVPYQNIMGNPSDPYEIYKKYL